MTSIPAGRLTPLHAWDRNFFLMLLVVIWSGIAAGFVPDILAHEAGGHVAFAPIVHVHALFYVGWLVLLTTQMALIRTRHADIHRHLGLIALAMIPAMAVLGPATALVMGRREFGTPDGDPLLLSVIFLDALNFAVIASMGLWMRRDAFAHRRLMILATVFVSDAGFGRWLGPPIAKLTGTGAVSFFLQNYIMTLILVSAMALYDLRTRARLHPVVAVAMAFGLADAWIACVIHEMPAWKPITARLLGH